jgi:hypothetical protein
MLHQILENKPAADHSTGKTPIFHASPPPNIEAARAIPHTMWAVGVILVYKYMI